MKSAAYFDEFNSCNNFLFVTHIAQEPGSWSWCHAVSGVTKGLSQGATLAEGGTLATVWVCNN